MTTSFSYDCGVCQESHHPSRCEKMIHLNPTDRRKLAEEKKLCYNCLGNNHTVKSCPSTGFCKICKGRHHSTLHIDNKRSSQSKIDVPNKRPKFNNSQINIEEVETQD